MAEGKTIKLCYSFLRADINLQFRDALAIRHIERAWVIGIYLERTKKVFGKNQKGIDKPQNIL